MELKPRLEGPVSRTFCAFRIFIKSYKHRCRNINCLDCPKNKVSVHTDKRTFFFVNCSSTVKDKTNVLMSWNNRSRCSWFLYKKKWSSTSENLKAANKMFQKKVSKQLKNHWVSLCCLITNFLCPSCVSLDVGNVECWNDDINRNRNDCNHQQNVVGDVCPPMFLDFIQIEHDC